MREYVRSTVLNKALYKDPWTHKTGCHLGLSNIRWHLFSLLDYSNSCRFCTFGELFANSGSIILHLGPHTFPES